MEQFKLSPKLIALGSVHGKIQAFGRSTGEGNIIWEERKDGVEEKEERNTTTMAAAPPPSLQYFMYYVFTAH